MSEISVLIISSADRGGAASIARQDAKSLAGLGISVGYAPGLDEMLDDKAIQQHWLPFIKASGLVERLLRLSVGQITAFLGIILLIKKYHYQIVINHVPHVSNVCGVACKICNIKAISMIHLPLSSFKAKRWMKPGDFNISISERGKDDLIERWNVDKKNIMVLPPTILSSAVNESDIQRNCESFQIRPDRPVAACVALFNSQKNHRLLIDAWQKVVEHEPEALLLLAGDGPLYSTIKKRVELKNLDHNVRFLGMVEPGWVYARSSFCVLPSKDEGIPLVFLEGAVHKRAFIASDTGANREFITSDWNGLLVPPDEEQKLADAILSLFQQPQKCVEFGRHAHERYLEFQSRTNRGDQLYRVLAALTNRD